MITVYLKSGGTKSFAHDVDAFEWVSSGLASFEPTDGRKAPAPAPEKKPEPEVKTVVEAIEEQAAPGVIGEEEAPAPAREARKAPRRRSAE